jgi:Zn-dependent M16 (insulinase) family peptidase
VQVAGNIVDKLDDPLQPWLTSFLPQRVHSTLELREDGILANLDEIKSSHAYHTEQVAKPGNGNVLSLGAIESSYLVQTYPGPTEWDDPDIAPLMVLNEYLTTMEGPFWKLLRGMGLAYSYAIRHRPEQGLLYFVLYKSVSIPKAYQQARNIIDRFIKKEVEFESTGVAAAKSSSIFSIISREETAPAAAAYSLLNYLFHAPYDTNKRMLEKVQEVTLDDLHRVLNKHLAPLFDPVQTNVSVTTNPTNTDEIKEFFETKMDKKIDLVVSVEDHYAD